MTLDEIKTFITLAEEGNFTRTGRRHFVTQSAVSSRIGSLERKLGQRLFLRDRRQLTLTAAGRIFLAYAYKMVNMEHTALSELSLIDMFTDLLYVGAVHSIYDLHLFPFLNAFIREHPTISLKVTLDHSQHIITCLANNTLDIGFTYRSYYRPGYNCVPFRADKVSLVTNARNTTYAHGITERDAFSLPLLYSDFVYADTTTFLPAHRRYLLDIDVGIKIVPYLVNNQEYYSFLPEGLVKQELDSGALIEIPLLDTKLPLLQSYMIYSVSNDKRDATGKWLGLCRSFVAP